MQRLTPYQTGLWLAEYIDIRCQLCRICRSSPYPELHQNTLDSESSSDRLVQATSTQTVASHKRRHQLSQHFSTGLLCAACHHSVVWLPKPFTVDIAAGITLSIQAATYYDYPIRQAIRTFKHDEDMTKLPLLLHVLRQLPRPHGCHAGNSVIVAMPTTNQRLVKRGFDPVSILSAQLSKHWQIPLWRGVERVDDAISQQGLTRAERLTNLDNAFALIQPPSVKRLLLFDDVATTGASLQALGRALYGTSPTRTADQSPPTHLYQMHAYALAHGSQL
ncbi:ComF family protein [Psychrobacter sp.]|uniref:ComF family protein n=1 Tax=Psychrobacter sp. TaxID=56811 RepID=UPI003F9A69A9